MTNDNLFDYNIIIPVAAKDIDTLMKGIEFIRKNLCGLLLPHRNEPQIVIITKKSEIGDYVNCLNGITIIDENQLVPGMTYCIIYNYLKQFGAQNRTGWYFQQFLKMGYALSTEKEYYISWDSDTIPIKKVNLMRGGMPIFSMKTEYHKPYFDTIYNLFCLTKQIDKSFISEHMIFKTEYMREIVTCLDSKDKPWYIQILDSIPRSEISGSGYSEFETYGTYVLAYHKSCYAMQDFKSIRDGRSIFRCLPNEKVLEWLSTKGDYNAISFEKWDKPICEFKLYRYRLFRKLVHPQIYIRGCRFIMKMVSLFNSIICTQCT